MCQSSSSLFFGVTVSTLDLCTAGAAFAHVKGTLLGVDLILARRAKGRLVTSVPDGKTDVRSLPAEVWQLVKVAVARVAYVDEYRHLEFRYHPCLSTDEYCEEDEVEREDAVLTFSNLITDDWSYDGFCAKGGLDAIVQKREKVRLCPARPALRGQANTPARADGSRAEQDVVQLLAHFGLCLASSSFLSHGDMPSWDIESSWAVALPFVRDESKCPELTVEIPHEMGPAHNLFRISDAVFSLPGDAHTRFRRLFTSFPAISSTSLATDTLRPAPEAAAVVTETGGEEGKEKVKKGGKSRGLSKDERKKERRVKEWEKRRVERQPGWMLLGTGLSCA